MRPVPVLLSVSAVVLLGVLVVGRSTLATAAQDAAPAGGTPGAGDHPYHVGETGHFPSPAANEALARRWFDGFANRGDLALAAELVAPDHVQHDTLVPAAADGPSGQQQMLLALRTGFPDLRFAVEDVVADVDTVVVRWTLRGTHDGEFSGLAPSGSPVTLPGTSIFRVEAGQIAESWVTYDSHWLLLQIEDGEA